MSPDNVGSMLKIFMKFRGPVDRGLQALCRPYQVPWALPRLFALARLSSGFLVEAGPVLVAPGSSSNRIARSARNRLPSV